MTFLPSSMHYILTTPELCYLLANTVTNGFLASIWAVWPLNLRAVSLQVGPCRKWVGFL
jgi:hypothetical protein